MSKYHDFGNGWVTFGDGKVVKATEDDYDANQFCRETRVWPSDVANIPNRWPPRKYTKLVLALTDWCCEADFKTSLMRSKAPHQYTGSEYFNKEMDPERLLITLANAFDDVFSEFLDIEVDGLTNADRIKRMSETYPLFKLKEDGKSFANANISEEYYTNSKRSKHETA